MSGTESRIPLPATGASASARAFAGLVVFLTLAAGAARADALPLIFEPNRGQAAPQVEFLARASGQTIFLTSSEVLMVLGGEASRAAVRLTFPGSAQLRLEAADRLAGESHYLLGNDPSGWRTRVPQFARVRAASAWDGVSIEFYGNQQRLEYDFVVAPHADASRIRFHYAGARSLRIDRTGALILETAAGPLQQLPPVAYQDRSGERQPVEARYELARDGALRLHLGDYDRSLPLVIDPVISFSTFIGGTGLDRASGIAVDNAGNSYIAGSTLSANYPVGGGVVGPAPGGNTVPGDAFVSKISPDGLTVLFSTFLGGSRDDEATGIGIDPAGNVVVAGNTRSTNFPTTFTALQLNFRSLGFLPDGFVSKLNPTGTALIYSTYLGGNRTDVIGGVAVDTAGNAYLAGGTDSTNFTVTAGAFRTQPCPNFGLSGFVVKISSDGSTRPYATLLCGSSGDEALGIAVDAAGSAYVVGRTSSSDFPIRGPAFQQARGGAAEDAFVSKLDAAGANLAYSTFLGGAAEDVATAVAVDGAGNAYVTGLTRSTDFPVTAGAAQTAHGDSGLFTDAFVAKVSPAGNQLVYASYLGGSGNDRGNAIAVGGSQNAHVAGETASSDFPDTGPRCQTGYGGASDAFLVKFNTAGTGLAYGLYLGGRDDDAAYGVAVDINGRAFVAGGTWSSNFTSTIGAFRYTYNGGYRGSGDAFVTRVDDVPDPAAPCISINGVVNGANFLAGPVAPGEIVSIFGDGLGPDVPVSGQIVNDRFTTELAGTRVLVNNVPAPIIATSRKQVNAILPYGAAGQAAIRVEYQGQFTPVVLVPVAATSPAIFALDRSGSGQGAILNQDYSVNGPASRAAKGSVIQIFATGEGQTTPAGVDGLLALSGLPKPMAGVSATVAGLPAVVQYFGAAPGLVAGVIQVNVFIPANAASGSAIPVLLQFGSNKTPLGITVAIQ